MTAAARNKNRMKHGGRFWNIEIGKLGISNSGCLDLTQFINDFLKLKFGLSKVSETLVSTKFHKSIKSFNIGIV